MEEIQSPKVNGEQAPAATEASPESEAAEAQAPVPAGDPIERVLMELVTAPLPEKTQAQGRAAEEKLRALYALVEYRKTERKWLTLLSDRAAKRDLTAAYRAGLEEGYKQGWTTGREQAQAEAVAVRDAMEPGHDVRIKPLGVVRPTAAGAPWETRRQ